MMSIAGVLAFSGGIGGFDILGSSEVDNKIKNSILNFYQVVEKLLGNKHAKKMINCILASTI